MIANLEGQNTNDLSKRIITLFDNTSNELKKLAKDAPNNITQSVHLIRKRLKFLRAFVKLTRHCSYHERYQAVNYTLRDLGRIFSDCRDAHVRALLLSETIWGKSTNRLVDDLISLNMKISQTMEERLLSEPNSFEALISAVNDKQITHYFESLDPNTDCLISGLALCYEKSYHAFHSGLTSHEADLLHEWRKRTKDLQYQMEALSEPVSTPLNPSLEQITKLCELLGQINDLFMFSEWLDSIEGSIDAKYQLNTLRNNLGRKLKNLEDQADNMGHSLFKLNPDEYRNELSNQLNR